MLLMMRYNRWNVSRETFQRLYTPSTPLSISRICESTVSCVHLLLGKFPSALRQAQDFQQAQGVRGRALSNASALGEAWAEETPIKMAA